MYRSLDADQIIATAERLHRRIEERFPGSGLLSVSGELLAETREAKRTALWLAKPHRLIRFATSALIASVVFIVVGTLFVLSRLTELFSNVSDFFQGVDAAVNELLLLGAAIYFLGTWEARHKRKRVLRAMQVLRSMAHIIDMHQLDKDPERLRTPRQDTPSSPPDTLSAYELTRYLDYCSEMLSILSKIAALYAQDLDDSDVLAAVDEVQDLTGGLSQKIWQKIMILDRVIDEKPVAATTPAR